MTAVRINANDIEFAYHRGSPIVQGFSEEFLAGQFVALTGPSGRGKSTLLYLLGLMLSPTGGRLSVEGEDVTKAKDGLRSDLRARRFGFVFQDAALDATRTVLDNVLESAIYRGDSKKELEPRAMALLDQFGVSVRVDHKPGEISGGQAQRIAVCRALLADPGILLADEPTGNLDAVSSRVVVNAMRSQAAGGAAVIVATHDRDVIDACDREVRL